MLYIVNFDYYYNISKIYVIKNIVIGITGYENKHKISAHQVSH